MNHDHTKTSLTGREHLQPLMIIATALAVVIGCFLLFTSPEQIGPGGVTVFFILGYCLSLCLFELVYRATTRKTKISFWLRAYYAALPIILFGLSSLRQLSLIDIIVIAVLTIATTTYHKRRAESPFNLI